MKNLSEVNKFFIKYKKKLILGFFFIIFSNLLQISIPLILKDGINFIAESKNYSELINYALLLIVVSLFSGIFRFSIRQTIIVVSREIEYDLLEKFWNHIQRLPLKFFKNTPAGQIMALATNDVSMVRTYLGPAVMYSLDTISKFIMILVILFSINNTLTLLMLIPIPIASYLVYLLASKIHKQYTAIQEKFEKLTTKAQESFSGIRVIKSYVREEYEKDDFAKISKDYMQKNINLIKVQSLFFPLLFLLIGLTLLIVIWFGGKMAIEGTLTLGDFIAFIAYLGLLTWPMIAFGWVANIIQQADASMGRLNKLFREAYEIEDNEKTDNSITDFEAELEFKNVTFSYNADRPVIKNVSFKIEKGKTLAIIGHTGSGKSTLVNLLPRMFEINSGEIIIDKYNLKNIPLKVLRKNIGYVPQEAFLFSDTFYNNITYGMDKKDENIFNRIISISRIDKDLENFTDGYNTIIGEKGITLSGGQKQRVALARALAVNPKILILDDSLSAVDTKTEEEILSQLKEFMKDRTSIIISHRVSTIKDADKIIVLKDGAIAEEGTHEQLVNLKGIYAELNHKQLLEQEIKDLS